MMKLKIELLKLFLLEFEWSRNKKEKVDEEHIEVVNPDSDTPDKQ